MNYLFQLEPKKCLRILQVAVSVIFLSMFLTPRQWNVWLLPAGTNTSVLGPQPVTIVFSQGYLFFGVDSLDYDGLQAGPVYRETLALAQWQRIDPGSDSRDQVCRWCEEDRRLNHYRHKMNGKSKEGIAFGEAILTLSPPS